MGFFELLPALIFFPLSARKMIGLHLDETLLFHASMQAGA
jgi:hypothetical protein